MKASAIVFGLLAALVNGYAPYYETAKAIPGQYVIVFKKGVEIESHMNALFEKMKSDSPANELLHQYNIRENFRGYSISCTQKVLDFIRRSDIIEGIYEDGICGIDAVQSNPPSWGLDRISQAALPLDKAFHYPDSAGLGVDLYTLDTGIYLEHNDFASRAQWGANFAPGSGDNDRNGHGTHCSGTMAGTNYGIAKRGNLFAVKVLGDSGSGGWADVIAGVNWVADRHTSTKKSVANMSLGGGGYTALDQAVDAAVDAGVYFAVAAGNNNGNACNYSPARASKAVCVAATNVNDNKSSFSNYGNCVEINAPGEAIPSTYIGGPNNVATLSGTSMASPHVAGVMALYLAEGRIPSIANLQADSTKDAIRGLPAGTPNYLLYVHESISSSTSEKPATPNRKPILAIPK